MPLRSLYDPNPEAEYEAERETIEFHAQLIAITEDVPIDEARRRARAEAEAAYFTALAEQSTT
ncbi:hypothetical protein [Aureimonas glaciei]|uniref:Uncharacterized protein n=1 Tax=Aureimonas glaciei TaxID=1776957 RepID=A0A916XZV0_9HYPH|nr:hypothetical protein [Aureimonas glaciei]GGD24523.1 hypothetical protein GCM10011335_29290 [Aureimonas glaciei]